MKNKITIPALVLSVGLGFSGCNSAGSIQGEGENNSGSSGTKIAKDSNKIKKP